jgi:hypothetical protein
MNDAVIPHRSGYKGILFFWILLVYLELILYICNMEFISNRINDKISALCDESDWLNRHGESHRYNFKIPLEVHHLFDKGVDDPIYFTRSRVGDQLREEQRVVYTNVYWGK